MRSCTARTVFALVFAVFIAISVSAAPENRSESGEWLTRQIDRIVHKLKKIIAPSPLDEIQPIPPKP